MSTTTLKDHRIALRLTGRQKALVEQAADSRGETLTEFSVTALVNRAEQVLADQPRLVLDEAQWQAFNNALDRPATVLPGLRDLMSRPSVFE
ncbi:MAG: DUF1778 domain-containing protein [Propionibacteriaceae bacterium]|jgi:uncharacterized protein (DUF1778 family)|nr:DUF1778 domain-containing protein [Propionibacteriaceae bacterium]